MERRVEGKMQTLRWRRWRGHTLLIVLLGLWGCGAHRGTQDLPTLRMHASAEGEPQRVGCRDAASVELRRGPVPSGHSVVVHMRVEADRPVPLWMFEQAMRERAARYCSVGVSLLRAEAAPGAEGYVTVHGVGWRSPPIPSHEPARGS
ncbi:MAG: hypothetical protein ACO3JL_00090 [Myxococcota bacterium]